MLITSKEFAPWQIKSFTQPQWICRKQLRPNGKPQLYLQSSIRVSHAPGHCTSLLCHSLHHTHCCSELMVPVERNMGHLAREFNTRCPKWTMCFICQHPNSQIIHGTLIKNLRSRLSYLCAGIAASFLSTALDKTITEALPINSRGKQIFLKTIAWGPNYSFVLELCNYTRILAVIH